MAWIGSLGYGLSALAFLFLFLLLLTTSKKSIQSRILLASTAVSALWSGSMANQVYFDYALIPFLGLETLKNLLWLLLLISAFSQATTFKQLLLEKQKTLLLVVSLLGFAVIEGIYNVSTYLNAYYILCIHLIQSIIGLWLVEQFYRLAPQQTKWMIKPLCIALGALFVFDFVMYADAVLLKKLDFNYWFARSWLTAATVPLILISTRRAQHWETRIYISRDVVYHSTLLLAAGGYLLLMALAGYFISFLGGEWSTVLQAVFIALGVLILSSLFLSDGLRRKVRVLITKHFFANKYEYREEWLKVVDVLDQESSGDQFYSIALSAMQQTFDCEFAALVIKKGAQWQIPAIVNCELDANHSAWLHSIGEYCVSQDWIFDLEEHKRQSNNERQIPIAVDKLTRPNFQLCIPVSNERGLTAVVLLSKANSTANINWEDRDLMRAISKQIATYLYLNITSSRLAESKQFDAFNRMSAFLVHDLKNVQAQLSLIASNAERHKDNPEFIDDAFETIGHAESRLNKVLNQLRNKRIETSRELERPIKELVSEAIELRQQQQPKPVLTQSCDTRLHIDIERFKSVLTHVIQNAQDATPADGRVEIVMHETNGYLCIEVRDSGEGMSEDFINTRLFKPFDTTKGNAGMGIGVYDAKQFFESIGGDITVVSNEGKGSCFTLMLPLPVQSESR